MQKKSTLLSRWGALGLSLWILLSTVTLAPVLLADHGPGTTGGGLTTQSAETSKKGQLSGSYKVDFTEFENLSSSDISRKARKVGGRDPEFDALHWSLLQTFILVYGLYDIFEISAAIGFYRGDDFREGHLHGTEVEVENLGDISGLTDLWINGKYRIVKGPNGSLAGYAGIKLPVGRDDVRGNGEDTRLEPSVQPGSGAFDFLFGMAYSVWLAQQVSLDTSAQYIARTSNDSFKVGDRIDVGIAAVYRLMEDIAQFPQVSLIGEINLRHLFRSESRRDRINNSGGTALFLSPGIRVGITESVAWTLMPQIPVIQDLNDEQQETLIKIMSAISVIF